MIRILCSLLVASCMIATVSSFSLGRQMRASSALKMNFEDAIGAQPPLGFWDPLGLLKEADQERFDRLRYVEMKHGRIAMLAILGHIVTAAGVRFPGNLADGLPYASIPAGEAALFGDKAIPLGVSALIFAFIGVIELGFAARQTEIEEAQLTAAQEKYGWDEETINKKTSIELNNGRAAQMGILGLMVHESLNNDPYIVNRLLGAPVDFNAGF
jgi:hypothetical protein